MPQPPAAWQDFKRREYSPSAFNLFGVLWSLLIPLFVYGFWSFVVTSDLASRFSRVLKMTVDLGTCAPAFASVQIAHRTIAFLDAAALFGIAILLVSDGLKDRENLVRYTKLALATTSTGVVYLWFSVREAGTWVSPVGRRTASAIDLQTACTSFHSENLLPHILFQWQVAFMMFAVFLMVGAILGSARSLLKAGLWGKEMPLPDAATQQQLAEAYAERGLAYGGKPIRSISASWRHTPVLGRRVILCLILAVTAAMTTLCLGRIAVLFS